MTEILPRVFIGDADVLQTRWKGKGPLTHVLTVMVGDLDCALPESVRRHLVIPLLDEPTADLLHALPLCFEFIDDCVHASLDGAVLVHCLAGISRSASVVMAFIMYSQHVDCPAAFRMLKKKYKPALPNEGFRLQLKLFSSMGNRIDKEHPEYRLYRLQTMVEEFKLDAKVAPASLAADPGMAAIDDTNHVRCRKCRRVLLTNRNVLDHSAGDGQLSFRWHKRDAAQFMACTSVFLEPMSWMAAELAHSHNEGKILCPKCSHRVGDYCWAGAQCSCGAWIVPAFQIQKGRVDLSADVVAPVRAAQPAYVIDRSGTTAADHHTPKLAQAVALVGSDTA